MAAKIDAYGACIPKYNEELCGDQVEIIRNESSVTAILADGISGGAKASLLTSFAVKMMTAMCFRGAPLDRTADFIAEAQSGEQQGGAGNIAFTLIRALCGGKIYVEQLGTPGIILLRRGKPVQMEMTRRKLGDKTLHSGEITAKQADTIIAVSSGMLAAGAERDLKNGWGTGTIAAYMANAYDPRGSAENLARLLLAAGNSLSFGRPKNDLSALVFRVGE